jgi:hypothetical protein
MVKKWMFLALNPKHSQPNPCRERPNKPPSSTMKLRANRTPRTCSINWSALAQAGDSTVPLIRISCGVLLTKPFTEKMQPCHWLSRSARRFSISLGFRLQAAVKGTKASNPTEHPTFPPKKKNILKSEHSNFLDSCSGSSDAFRHARKFSETKLNSAWV